MGKKYEENMATPLLSHLLPSTATGHQLENLKTSMVLNSFYSTEYFFPELLPPKLVSFFLDKIVFFCWRKWSLTAKMSNSVLHNLKAMHQKNPKLDWKSIFEIL